MTLPAAVIRAQLVALEAKYAAERRSAAARKLLDLCHQKRDELAMALTCTGHARLPRTPFPTTPQ